MVCFICFFWVCHILFEEKNEQSVLCYFFCFIMNNKKSLGEFVRAVEKNYLWRELYLTNSRYSRYLRYSRYYYYYTHTHTLKLLV